MGCVCGRLKKKKDTLVSLPLEGREIVEWPERNLEKPDRRPELPPRPYRPPPMNHCGRWATRYKTYCKLTNISFAALILEMLDVLRDAGCRCA